ncbi:MAG: T9SS type A sorting domain-containing protein, partial [Candidatus Marinimicrobia bacterium]|nr:T9SS type A sorting domain-containing protein [Candidatus Neomarinimicrobiota bacterium]
HTLTNPAFNTLKLFVTATGLATDDILLPEEFALRQNYPNPFNPVTTIQYNLPDDAHVSMVVYDIMGRQVRTLVNDVQSAGYRTVKWNATNEMGQPVSAGMYFYVLKADDFTQIRKMVLLK